MTALELFEVLAPLLAPAVEAEIGRGDTCIFNTRVALEVAAYFGIEAQPLAVQVFLANRAFTKHLDEGDHDVEKWAAIDGSHSVGIGFGFHAHQPRENAWNGHLIAVADGCFGDFAIQQAERPEKGITTGPAIVGPWPGDKWTLIGVDGTAVHYRKLDDEDYRRSPDWRIAARRRPVCARLIRILRSL